MLTGNVDRVIVIRLLNPEYGDFVMSGPRR